MLVMLLAVISSGARSGGLMGLVVLPTRDLAVQVHSVLQRLAAAAGIRLALAAAQEAVPAEAAKLVERPSQPGSGPQLLVATPGRLMAHLHNTPGVAPAALLDDQQQSLYVCISHVAGGSHQTISCNTSSSCCSTGDSSWLTPPASWSCYNVDSFAAGSKAALVCLAYHNYQLSAAGFSLKALRFLVVDEADRLLRQEYQNWLPEVLHQTEQQQQQHVSSHQSSLHLLLQQQQHQHQPNQTQHQNLQPYSSSSSSSSSSMPLLPYGSSSSRPRCVKLIVSATLTRDPGKLLRLGLHNPRFLTLTEVNRRYSLPALLQQHKLVVPAQHKPLALLALLHQLAGSTVLVFASSLETTHRWAVLEAAATQNRPLYVAPLSLGGRFSRCNCCSNMK
jgi:ATP-dependent RNA helicase DDX51/DBP6